MIYFLVNKPCYSMSCFVTEWSCLNPLGKVIRDSDNILVPTWRFWQWSNQIHPHLTEKCKCDRDRMEATISFLELFVVPLALVTWLYLSMYVHIQWCVILFIILQYHSVIVYISVLARHIPKGTVPFGASNVPFAVWLKTTMCPLGCSNYLHYLKVMSRLEKWKTADKSHIIHIK